MRAQDAHGEKKEVCSYENDRLKLNVKKSGQLRCGGGRVG